MTKKMKDMELTPEQTISWLIKACEHELEDYRVEKELNVFKSYLAGVLIGLKMDKVRKFPEGDPS